MIHSFEIIQIDPKFNFFKFFHYLPSVLSFLLKIQFYFLILELFLVINNRAILILNLMITNH